MAKNLVVTVTGYAGELKQGKTVRFIKDYALMELSIVDSPANELCNILSISK